MHSNLENAPLCQASSGSSWLQSQTEYAVEINEGRWGMEIWGLALKLFHYFGGRCWWRLWCSKALPPQGCHHSGSGNWTVAHVRLWVSGPGRGGPQAVVCTSEGTYSILNTAVKEVGTLWSQCGRARKLGHLAGRFPETPPHLQKSKEHGAWASCSLGSQFQEATPIHYAAWPPKCCLPRDQTVSSGKGQCYIQTDLGSHPGSSSGRLLDPRQVIPFFATWFLCL